MTTRTNSRRIKIAALLLVVSTLVYAVFHFDPSSQPLVTLAPYGLKSYDLSTPNNKAYRPWLENGAYQGDVIEYNLNADGVRTTDAPVGLNPISDAEKAELYTWGIESRSAASLDARQNWMARATFYAQECADSVCSSYTDYWKNRNIFTYNVGVGKIPFTWSALSDLQKQALDPAAADPNGDGNTSDMLADSEVLNYVRGDHTNEKNQLNGTLRSRFSLLGDIVNSSPVYIGQPVENYLDQDFQDFKLKYTTDFRDDLVVIGANDGMLHVFDADDGSEVYAYIPSMLISKLPKLAVPPPYQHTYYVDGRLTVASAKIDTEWKTVLTSGLGAGGKGLFALDMTSEDPLTHSVLFEKSNEIPSAEFGYIYGRPTIYGMADGDWYVITGNGYGAGRAKLLLVNLRTKGVTAVNTTDSDANAGLSEPSLIDVNNDQIGDYVYAGDTKGQMWKFDFTKFDPTNPASVVVTMIHGGNPDQPITTAPAIGEHPNGGYMVYFATGNASSLTDAIDRNYPPQAIYGIWDQATGSTIVPQTLGEDTATFSSTTTTTVDNPDGTTTSSTTTTSNTETVRYVVNDPFTADPNVTYQYICPANDNTCTAIKGWTVPLGLNERLIGGSPQLRAGRVTLVLNNPTGTNVDPDDPSKLTADLEGDSWLMSLDYLTGGDGVGTERDVNGGVALNLSGDDLLNEDDMLTVNGVLKAPVGLRLGEGTISQPAIARRGPAIDIMYINGLKLKLPQIEPGGPFFNGHIDVVTDSPGPVGGLKAPNDLNYMSEGYNFTENDGYGNAVDGLVHEYSNIHGITYVDLFELEPRRGLTSKEGTPFPPVNGLCPTGSTEIKKKDGTLYGCVVTHLDAELNRAYDTYTMTVTNAHVALVNGTCPPNDSSRFGPFYTENRVGGALVDCTESIIDPESEVYLLGGTTPIPKDKPFIVTLANADLSTAGILQIGCRTWKVDEYEDMITSQLEDTVNPKTPAELADTIHNLGAGSLLFTLADIASGATDNGYTCPDDSPLPTLRVSFEQRSILDLGIHGTRSQCVLGLHQPEDKVCYADPAVLAAAESTIPRIEKTALPAVTPDDDPTCGNVTDPWGPPKDYPDSTGVMRTYLQDPAENWHITWNRNDPDPKSKAAKLTGFRWRNGALTLQLLDATGGAKHFTLQPADTLLRDKNNNRKGGTFAKAFDAEVLGGKPTGVITDRNSKGPNESGLLYEAAMYWHYGRLADDIRTSTDLGSGNPSSTPCFGGSNYYSRLQIEASGANPGEAERIITKEITPTEYKAYTDALKNVKECDSEAACEQALLDLAQMMADDPAIALLDSIFDYIDPNDLDLPPEYDDTNDSTPNRDVEELDFTQGVKPQFIKSQRRSWIDLRP